jgi:hypothetical protein
MDERKYPLFRTGQLHATASGAAAIDGDGAATRAAAVDAGTRDLTFYVGEDVDHATWEVIRHRRCGGLHLWAREVEGGWHVYLLAAKDVEER